MAPFHRTNETEKAKQDKAVYQQSPRNQVHPFPLLALFTFCFSLPVSWTGSQSLVCPQIQNLEEILVPVKHSLPRPEHQPKRWALEGIHSVGASSAGQNPISPAAMAEAVAALPFLPSRAVATSVQTDQEGPQRLHRIHNWIQPLLCLLCGSSFHLRVNAQILGQYKGYISSVSQS